MINVIGAGAFGTALAISLARQGPVTLWARDANHVAEMATTRENARRLAGVALPDMLTVTDQFPSATAGQVILAAIPMQHLRQVLAEHRDALSGAIVVACCKGIELSTGLGPAAVIAEMLPDATAAILTGPGFAQDLARGVPTAMTLAVTDRGLGQDLQERLSTANLRLYRSTDVTGAELGGALKNVLAIGCGAVMGAGLGESARAALITRGFVEITRLAMAQGADPHTLQGLSGFGDLVLTCTSAQSRNYRFGESLGAEQGFDPAVTVEGVPTAHAVLARAEKFSVDMPVTRAIVALIDGQHRVQDIVETLLARPLKEE